MVFAMNQKGKVDHLGEELYTELYDISNVNKAREIVQTSNDFFCTMVKTCDQGQISMLDWARDIHHRGPICDVIICDVIICDVIICDDPFGVL